MNDKSKRPDETKGQHGNVVSIGERKSKEKRQPTNNHQSIKVVSQAEFLRILTGKTNISLVHVNPSEAVSSTTNIESLVDDVIPKE